MHAAITPTIPAIHPTFLDIDLIAFLWIWWGVLSTRRRRPVSPKLRAK
jgi:hypothetical protein